MDNDLQPLENLFFSFWASPDEWTDTDEGLVIHGLRSRFEELAPRLKKKIALYPKRKGLILRFIYELQPEPAITSRHFGSKSFIFQFINIAHANTDNLTWLCNVLADQEFRSQSINFILEIFRQKEHPLRFTALDILEQMVAKEAGLEIAKCLREQEHETRFLRILETFYLESSIYEFQFPEEVLKVFLQYFDDFSSKVRLWIIQALQSQNNTGHNYIRRLCEKVFDKYLDHEQLCMEAIEALGELKSRTAEQALCRALENSTDSASKSLVKVQRRMVKKLKQIGILDETLDVLKHFEHHPHLGRDSIETMGVIQLRIDDWNKSLEEA